MSSLIIFLSYYFFFIFVFLYDKNLREKEGWHGGSMLQWVGAWWSNFGYDLIMFWWEKKKKRRSSLKVSFRTLLLHKSWDFSMRKIRYHKIWKLRKHLEKKIFSYLSIEIFLGHQSLMYWKRKSVFSQDPFLLHIISDFREIKRFNFSLIPLHILYLLKYPRDSKNIFRLTIWKDLQEASTSSGSSFDEPPILLQPCVDHL